MLSNETISTTIKGLSELISQGTAWEQGFFDSVKTQFESKGSLSPRQQEILTKIANNYSQEAIKQRAEWKSMWDERKAEIARVCAKYYLENTGYFHSTALDVLHDPDFIPSLKQYRSMCENKYASKVLEAYFKEPEFPVGSLAQLRTQAAKTFLVNNQAMVVIIRDDMPIASSAKGCKRYKVLQVGGSQTFLVEERDLKHIKKGANK